MSKGAELAPRDICVVVLNYNGGPLLRRVVAAVRASQGIETGVVVVDNGSTDGSMEALIEQIRAGGDDLDVLALRAGQNLGFAAGNNLGLYGLSARYIALLNDDAILEPDTLAALVRFMDGHRGAGACGPRLQWPDGRPQPFSHGGDPTPAYLLRRAWARRSGRELHRWDGRLPRSVDWVAGTCLVLRAEALATVGLLDEGIFMYFEDNDLCLRLRRRGWGVYFVPEARVRHYNRPSYRDRRRLASYYRGLGRFYARQYSPLAGLAIRVLAAVRLGLLRATERSGPDQPAVR